MINIESDMDKLAAAIGTGALGAIVESVTEEAKALAPGRSGTLRDSIEGFITGAGSGSIDAAAPYASFVHDGTGLYGPSGAAYAVSARIKKALCWPGASHPVRTVTVRGIEGREFITRALEGPAPDQAVQGLIDRL